jgi:hypothetical protein
MSLKLKAIAAVVFATGAAVILLQHRTLQKLQAENATLQQQIAQLKSESQGTPASDSKQITDKDFDELLRLRGEVSTLRAQTNELQEQNQKLQQAILDATHQPHLSGDTNSVLGRANFNQQYRTAELALKGMLSYASNHDNNLPDTFDQAASYYTSQALATNLGGFVITYQGALTNIANPPDAIVVQSFQPFIVKELNRDGFTNELQEKIYGFADGHVEGHGVGIDGNFEKWEQKHIPVLKF